MCILYNISLSIAIPEVQLGLKASRWPSQMEPQLKQLYNDMVMVRYSGMDRPRGDPDVWNE